MDAHCCVYEPHFTIYHQLLAGKHLIDFAILVVHIHHLPCVWRHVFIRSECFNIQNFRNNLAFPSIDIIIDNDVPLFTPNAIYMQIVPDGMVIKWITGEFQTLWSNLRRKNQVKMKVTYSKIYQWPHDTMLTKFRIKAIKFPTNLGAGWDGPLPERNKSERSGIGNIRVENK